MNNLPTFVLRSVLILGYEARDYTSQKTGKPAHIRQIVCRQSGKVMKLRVDRELSLADYVDREIDLTLVLETFGDNLEPSVKVTALA